MDRGHVLKLEFSLLGMMWPGDDQQASPPQKRRASPPLRHSAIKTADKKDGGQARQRRVNPRSIDNSPLKADSNKPMHREFCKSPNENLGSALE